MNTHPHFISGRAWAIVILAASLVPVRAAFAQSRAEFHQTLIVTSAEPVTLDVEVSSAELQVFYSRDGEVSITGIAQASGATKLDVSFFKAVFAVDQSGNRLTVRHAPNGAYPEQGINVLYRIDVPYRTEVSARVNHGSQSFSGIMGPVKAATGKGDIKASYISKGLQGEIEHGNLDLKAIGEHVEAKTGAGNIYGERLGQGINAETGDGDITLVVVGPSTATVKRGTGRIDVGGARSSFTGSTSGGDLHIKAIPHDDWQLSSASGTIRLELPAVAKFELDASTDSGELQIDRDDLTKSDAGTRHVHQKVNGGEKCVVARTISGNIAIR